MIASSLPTIRMFSKECDCSGRPSAIGPFDLVWTTKLTVTFSIIKTFATSVPNCIRIDRDDASALSTVKVPDHIFSFGSWIGVDRDGNPNITASTVETTIKQHRQTAVKMLGVGVEKASIT